MCPRLLPDNSPEDSYLYELLVLTGAKSEATCKSKASKKKAENINSSSYYIQYKLHLCMHLQ